MKVRKCPKCGGNVPEGNEVCNNCGNSMSFFGRNVTLGGNYTKNGANTIPGGNPFESKKSNSTSFVVVIFVVIFIYIVYSMVAEFIYLSDYEPEEGSSFQDDFSDYYDEIEDYYESDNDFAIECSKYCGGDDDSDVLGDRCYCSNGNIYDEYGLLIYDNSNLDDSFNNIYNSITGWYSDVMSGKTVVTVVAASYCNHCAEYKPVIESLASKYGFTLYYIYIDELSSYEEELLLKTFNLEGYEDLVPYTYVVKNLSFVDGNTGYMQTDELYTFLKNNGVI